MSPGGGYSTWRHGSIPGAPLSESAMWPSASRPFFFITPLRSVFSQYFPSCSPIMTFQYHRGLVSHWGPHEGPPASCLKHHPLSASPGVDEEPGGSAEGLGKLKPALRWRVQGRSPWGSLRLLAEFVSFSRSPHGPTPFAPASPAQSLAVFHHSFYS